MQYYRVTLLLAAFTSCLALADSPATTKTGIPLDTPWKAKVYEFAVKNVQHPSWGLTHSERDYQVTLTLASHENIPIDSDVLFAAAFLHDVGGIGQFQKKGVDHAVRSVEIAEPFLREAGFPMEKWPAVREMILKHVYYGEPSQNKSAALFRDADILDFLGDLGIARILAVVEEPGREIPLLTAFELLGKFEKELPGKLASESARQLAQRRLLEMKVFFRAVKRESFDGKAL